MSETKLSLAIAAMIIRLTWFIVGFIWMNHIIREYQSKSDRCLQISPISLFLIFVALAMTNIFLS